MTKSNIFRSVVMTAIAGVMATLAACNTVEGVGEDTASVGRAIDRTAEDAKD